VGATTKLLPRAHRTRTTQHASSAVVLIDCGTENFKKKGLKDEGTSFIPA